MRRASAAHLGVRCRRAALSRVRRAYSTDNPHDAAREKVLKDLIKAKQRYTENRTEWQPVVQALLRFGVNMEENARVPEAEECYREAHRLANFHDPSDSATAMVLGTALRKRGCFADAQAFFSESITKLEVRKVRSLAEWTVLGHAWEGRAMCTVMQEDVPAAIPSIEKSLSFLRKGLPMPFAESAHEWVKFLMGVFERPHLRGVPRIGDLKFAEQLCKETIATLEKEAAANTTPSAPQTLLDAIVDLSTIKVGQHDFAKAEAHIDEAYEVWRTKVKPVVEDAERDVMEMQMRVLTARRSHANSSNAATEYRKAMSDYNSAIRLGESKDNLLQKPAFDLLATAHACLGHLRLELGWPKCGANNAEAEKHFDTVRSLQRNMLTQSDPLTISASFITKQVQLAKKDRRFQLRLELLSRRQENVLADLSVQGAKVTETHQVINAGKEAKFEVTNLDLDPKSTESHFQEIVLHVYSDLSKQKLLDVHREFVMTT